MEVKNLGQVFTPKAIVKDILDVVTYCDNNILRKHVIDNSCGEGAFLVEIVDRYIKSYYKKKKTYDGVKEELEKYIHGIEYDRDIYQRCLDNLKEKVDEYKLGNVKFDILNFDTLKTDKYNKKMDFVIGNPPYVRVHHLEEQYKTVKKFSFCENGMTDLYIVFYEIGLNMLNDNGILCYITPNSFYNSIAGKKLRAYIKRTQSMELLMDLGHYQPFDVTTYTTICKICNNTQYDNCKYYKYNAKSGKPEFIANINYSDLFIDDNIIISKNNKKFLKYLSYNLGKEKPVTVKNGFATLNDQVFIKNEFNFKKNVIDILKASTGQWKKCIYPYDDNGKVIPFNELDNEIQDYLKKNKESLSHRDTESLWYAFGRTQAINDVKLNKIAINTCIKDINSIKLNLVEPNKGLYSGLYMITDIPFKYIKEKICSEKFIEYLQVLNKCKSGGYYTFSSKDLAKFINYSMEVDING